MFVDGARVAFAEWSGDLDKDSPLRFRNGETTRLLMIGVNTGGPYKFIGSVQFDSPGHDIEINVEGPEANGLVFWSELVVERK